MKEKAEKASQGKFFLKSSHTRRWAKMKAKKETKKDNQSLLSFLPNILKTK